MTTKSIVSISVTTRKLSQQKSKPSINNFSIRPKYHSKTKLEFKKRKKNISVFKTQLSLWSTLFFYFFSQKNSSLSPSIIDCRYPRWFQPKKRSTNLCESAISLGKKVRHQNHSVSLCLMRKEINLNISAFISPHLVCLIKQTKNQFHRNVALS